jgi:hypothetical protein
MFRGQKIWSAKDPRSLAMKLNRGFAGGAVKNWKQFYWVSGTVLLTAVWLSFVFYFEPDFVGTLATATATACVIALIQSRLKA